MSSPDDTVRRIADQLENEFGECVLGRPALIQWLNQLLDRLTQLQVPSHTARDMIDSEYILWQAQALGMDPNEGA